jgi:hypothetical protein
MRLKSDFFFFAEENQKNIARLGISRLASGALLASSGIPQLVLVCTNQSELVWAEIRHDMGARRRYDCLMHGK